MSYVRKILVCAAVLVGVLSFSASAKAKEAHSGKSSGASGAKSEKAKLSDPDIAQREYMKDISRQLGVTCAHCHDVKNYKSGEMETHKTAKTHMEMVELLNEKFPGKVGKKVDCYMCHRAHAKWDYKAPAKLGEEEVHETSETKKGH